jgi:hypothetical protein
MRANMKWIMALTAVTFVGLMVFGWGMDITGRTGSDATGGELGRVRLVGRRAPGLTAIARRFDAAVPTDAIRGAQNDMLRIIRIHPNRATITIIRSPGLAPSFER